ncbi:hypothetical protein PMAYCL1PPCAC_02372 [Pristionchus mayeri]|uniref:Alpha-carbonic anhydrase domain-containing protein n=1 Tax=Pristionchus mayeri TaxID=1317129 RepID=A0AAN5C6W2_9BILA|nr:hypothetical protein PMAYCL1PPCAC_02372 [Pristionchus mayeri]
MARKRRLTVKKGPENVSGSLNKSIPSSSCPSPPPRKSRRISRQPRSIQRKKYPQGTFFHLFSFLESTAQILTQDHHFQLFCYSSFHPSLISSSLFLSLNPSIPFHACSERERKKKKLREREDDVDLMTYSVQLLRLVADVYPLLTSSSIGDFLSLPYSLPPDVTMKRQSPIDIRTETVCEDAEHCQIESVKIDYVVGDCKSVSCSPGGWKVQVRDNCSSFFAARHLPAKFKLEQFHAHWSEDGSCGSEHTLNGRPLSGEVHFVFYNTTYGSFANALAQDDGLAVIGVFIKEGEHNDNYQPLVDCIRNAAETGHEQEMPTYFHIRQLLPPLDERDFVTYEGSLTTPPYSEAVIWTVLTHPVEISAEQLNVFRQIVPKNYRDCQDLCDRRVRVTRAAAVAH